MKWKKSVRNFQSESREVETYILQKLEIKPSSAFELDLETGAAPPWEGEEQKVTGFGRKGGVLQFALPFPSLRWSEPECGGKRCSLQSSAA